MFLYQIIPVMPYQVVHKPAVTTMYPKQTLPECLNNAMSALLAFTLTMTVMFKLKVIRKGEDTLNIERIKQNLSPSESNPNIKSMIVDVHIK